VAILVVISVAGLAHAQSGADEPPVILLHPGVATVFQLPDAIVHARIHDRGEIRLAIVGDELFVRPRPGTPAGMKASLEMETRTARWTFHVVVVARARDARRDVQVPPVDAQAAEQTPPAIPAALAAPLALPAGPVAPPPAVTPGAAEPGTGVPSPASTAPAAPTDAPETAARDTELASRSRLELAAFAVGGLGFTGARAAEYEPRIALRRQHSFGLRLTAEPRISLWAAQVDVNMEWLAGPMMYEGPDSILVVSGPRLGLEAGARASTGTQWRASVYAGGGIQVHLRRTRETDRGSRSIMERGAVLTLGVGLQYRIRSKVLLGLDFLVRQGGLDDYNSVTGLLSVGRFLDEGNR
jgi:hypothetical protein